jgi:hypothetical protein
VVKRSVRGDENPEPNQAGKSMAYLLHNGEFAKPVASIPEDRKSISKM